MKAKKSLGQHFLKSQKALNTMISVSSVKKGDLILEIGPGRGSLTETLFSKGARVIAIEKDEALMPLLSEKFAKEIKNGQLNLICGDILELNDLKKIGISKTYKIVANIPYYITGQIIRKFLDREKQPKSMTLLVQKEVAERITAKNHKESLLSLSVKAFGKPKYIEKVPKGAFAPIPKVDSAIIHIDDISREKFRKMDEKRFFDLIHAGFAHKRKQIFPNLSVVFDKEKILKSLEKAKIPLNSRAEDIGIDKWLELCDIINKYAE